MQVARVRLLARSHRAGSSPSVGSAPLTRGNPASLHGSPVPDFYRGASRLTTRAPHDGARPIEWRASAVLPGFHRAPAALWIRPRFAIPPPDGHLADRIV